MIVRVSLLLLAPCASLAAAQAAPPLPAAAPPPAAAVPVAPTPQYVSALPPAAAAPAAVLQAPAAPAALAAQAPPLAAPPAAPPAPVAAPPQPAGPPPALAAPAAVAVVASPPAAPAAPVAAAGAPLPPPATPSVLAAAGDAQSTQTSWMATNYPQTYRLWQFVTAAAIVKALCMAGNVMVQVSPYPQVKRWASRGCTGEADAAPYVSIAFGGWQWCFYGTFAWLLTGRSGFLILVHSNSLGALLYAFTVKWGLYRVVSEGLAVFLMHNGVGARSVNNAIIAGVAWSLISTLIPLVCHAAFGWKAYFLCVLIFAACLLIFYLLLWLLPEDVIHRRPAMISYARFFSISIIFLIIGLLLLYYQHKAQMACFAESIFAMWDLFIPLIVFRTLVQDSQFWQGLYTQTKSNLNEPLLGMWEMGRDTIGVVADSIAQLENHIVPVIPFGVLTIDSSEYFSGGTARVYKGVFKQEEVAVKILFCIELTPDRVISFCNESSLLHSLKHPNVVNCHGVSVMPPAIALVTEFCHHGSLYDFLHKSDFQFERSRGSSRNSALMRVSLITPDNDPYAAFINRHSNASVESLASVDEDKLKSLRMKKAASSSALEDSFRVGSGCTNLDSDSGLKVSGALITHSDIEANELSGDTMDGVHSPRASEGKSIRKILRSAATVMQSSFMGFGLGPAGAVRADDVTHTSRLGRQKSVSKATSMNSLLAQGDPSRQSMGHLLPRALRIRMARDACAGVAYLHSKRMMHCDIKSLNFLVTRDFTVKLADLGEARNYVDVRPSDLGQLPRNINWTSPEVLTDKREKVSEISDVWSLGLVVSEIISGDIPFDTPACRNMTIDEFVQALENNLRPPLPSSAEDWLSALINASWRFDPETRCSAKHMEEVLSEHTQQEKIPW